MSQWYGIAAPRGTPAEIIDRLNREINAAFADPRMKARLTDVGGTVLPGTPEEFQKFVASEMEKWAKVVKFAGLKAE
jgi:tripartite-type tricarboxylate transporter receptor subunit TctC